MVTQEQLDELWDYTDPAGSEQRFAEAAREQRSAPEARAELETQVARAMGMQSRFDEARQLLNRIIFDSPPVSSRVLLELGRIHHSSGHPVEAMAHLTSARATAQRAGLAYLEIDALHMLALADTNNAAQWTEEALAVAEASADDHTQRWAVTLHTDLGWHLHDTANYEEALTQFSLAQGAAIRFGDEDQRFQSRWAFARCLRSLGRLDEAREIQQELASERPGADSVTAELAELSN